MSYIISRLLSVLLVLIFSSVSFGAEIRRNMQNDFEESVVDHLFESDYYSEMGSSSETVDSNLETHIPMRYVDLLEQELENMKSKSRYSRLVSLNQGKESSGRRHRLFYVWMPKMISKDANTNIITTHFEQNLDRNKYEGFTASQIVLTLKSSVMKESFPNGTYIVMQLNGEKWNAHSKQVEPIQFRQRQQVLLKRKFYSFNVTKFIKSKVMHNLTEAQLVNISFKVIHYLGKEQKTLDFAKLFDLEQERPALIVFFTPYVPSPMHSFSKYLIRERRSIGKNRYNWTTSSISRHYCERREFFATPEQVDWPNIIQPKEIDLGMCVGMCPFPLENLAYNFTMHAFLMDRVRHLNGHILPLDFPRASCVPVKYKPIHILEIVLPTSDVFQKLIVEDISVEQCGCR